ncbi:PREDICTED: transport and Golgi organization protein 1 isoform X1 [Polistes canadensis]|uniref:transport and Golgi organization protein 1 isoform X1 n=1 Tax=Polistes canadensis TaxID=91411 RepID=UPI000718BFB0|nr:PREDICTED: transport and Golgi organization protein 1 isoform X1 [Polistes canadensis]
MTKITPFTKISFLVFTIILCVIPECSSILSDKRLCYDPKCSEPVSLARTTLTYVAGEKGMVTVPVSTIVTVYSKGAGKRPDLWGVEFNGNRGYIPKNFLKEYKVLKKNLTYEVPTETVNNSKNNNDNNYNDISNLKDIPIKDNENKPDSIPIYSSPPNANIDASVLTAKEENTEQSMNEIVIDGTTIPINNEESTEPNNASVIEATPLLNSKQAEDNVNTDIKPTATQIELNIPTTPQQETEISKEEEELKIVTYSDTLNTYIEPNKSIVESQLNEDNNNNNNDITNFSNVESTEEEKKDNIDSFFSYVENEKEKINIDSSKFVSEHEQEKISVSSLNIELENKEIEHDTISLTVKSEENVKIKDNLESSTSESEYKYDNNNDNVFPSIIESDSEETNENKSVIEEEIKIENNIIENTNDTDYLFSQTESPKQVEVEDKMENVHNLDTSNMDRSNDMVSTINSSDGSNVSENISNDKEKVEQFVNEKDGETTMEGNNQMEVQDSQNNIVNSDVNKDNVKENTSSFGDVPMELNIVFEDNNKQLHSEEPQSSQNDATDIISEQIFHEFRNNRNLLLVEENVIPDKTESQIDDVQNNTGDSKTENLPKYEDIINIEDKFLPEMEDKDKIEDEVLFNKDTEDLKKSEDVTFLTTTQNMHFSDVCTVDSECINNGDTNYGFISQDKESVPESSIMRTIKVEHTYWVTLLYLSITAITTLVFSLGYYYIENMRRDGQLIAKINKLEKQLFISTKESLMLDEHLKSTKNELCSVQDKSFGSNEMVLSLKTELELSQKVNVELEEQIAMLEKDLESATEAGLELERMLREVLSSNNEVNPLTQSVEDLQARLNVQQNANKSLTNALNVKTQENEALLIDLNTMKKKYGELDTELIRITEEFRIELSKRNKIQENLNELIQQLEVQITQLSMDKVNLYKELKIKEAEMKDLVEVINQVNSNNLDIEKLYEVSHVKAEASQLLEERNDLKIRLSEVEGAHSLLEEHMKLVKEEVSSLSEQCKVAEKEKRDAETRLEVISNFFKEKEAQRQKEEALWLQKQGEVTSTVERIQTMQNEIQGYKQQIEMLKREIVDQEREYKSQISILETKAHEQWVTARQNERRLEESKAEAGQLRNRLTLIEKNLSDADADTKLHRLEANGETTTSPPLFIGAESSSSPIMFTGSSGVPPPPPSFMHPSLFPTYLPPPLPSGSGLPPYDVGQRPPPLGGRLSSPPPLPLHPHPSGRYDNADSPPPLISPPLLLPFNHRSHPPPFASDHMHPPPPPPPPGSILLPPLGTSHSWGEETLQPPRNSGYHPHQREQRARNHKGSLHSSGESLDKSHHSGKV